MARPFVSVVVVVGLSFVIGISAWAVLAPLVGDIGHAVLKPDIHLAAQSFDVGTCQTGSWNGIPWGQITDIEANVTLTNSGNLAGYTTVSFTEDGSALKSFDFYVQAGQTTKQTAQLQVGDCLTHTYFAQITNVRSA